MEEFNIELQAMLDKVKSKRQVNSDIKELQKSINMLRLTATLMKGDSKKAINQVVRQMEGQLSQVKLKAKIDQRNLKADVNKALNNISFDDIDMNFDSGKAKLKAKKVIADVKKAVQSSPISVNIELKKEKLDNNLTTYLSRNTKIKESQNLLDEADKLREKISKINDKDSLRFATDNFNLFKSEVQALGYQTKSTSEKIQNIIGKVTKIGSIFSVASLAVNKFQQSLQTIKENDTLLTEISKSSDMASDELQKLGDSSYQIASKYGKIASSYLTAAQEMSRAGYENAASMAELSVAAQGAGDMVADVANQYIIATDVAFKMNGSIEALTTALDGANNISNHNAVNMTELATGMSVVGSQAASSQMEVNEVTAAIGTMVAATQKSGSEMANAFKGILMNLQQVSGDVGDGEDIIDTDSLTKYEKACAELGVSLSTVKDGIVSLKKPMQILKELSEEYTKLDESDAKRANLLSAIGGKYRANALNAILENYDMYSKMLNDYAEGTNSMALEAEKTADSIEGRINALQNSWDSLVNSITNKDAFKNGVSLFDGLISSVENLIDLCGMLPVAMAGVTAFKTAKDKDYGLHIFDDKGNFDLSGNFMGLDLTQMKHFKEAEKAIDGWNKKLKLGQVDINDFGEDVVKNNTQLREYLKTCSVDAPGSLEGYKQHLQAAGEATNSLRFGTVLLNTALSFGIGMAVQGVITGISKLASASNDIQEKAKEVGSSFNDTKSDIEDYKAKIKELQTTINDSSSSIADVTEARKNLMSIQDELIEKYGSETDTIHIITDAINDQADALDNLSKKKYIEAKNEFNKEDFFENMSNNFNGYSDNMDRMVSEMEESLTLNLRTAYNSNMEEYKKFEKVISQYGTIGTGNIYAGGNGINIGTISFDGGLDSIYEKLLKIQEIASHYDFGSDDFNKHLTDKINETKEKLDKYSDLYNNYVLYDKILSDSGEKNGYDEVFKNLTDSYNQYKEVLASGDNEKVEQAQNDYARLFTEATESIKDDSVIEYFRNMYPELQEIVRSWQFNLDFSQNTENVKTDVQDALDHLDKDGFTIESLVDFKRETATEEQIQNYSVLEAVASKYSMTIEQLVSLLEKMGLVKTESYKQLVSKFGKENVKSLSDEEIEFAYTIKSTDSMTFDQLKEKIKEIKDSAKDSSISFSEVWKSIGTSGDEKADKKAKEAKEELLELAEAGKLTEEAFQKSSIASIFTEAGISAEEATQKINEMKSSADQLVSMKTGISSISSILGEKKDNLSSKKTRNEGIGADTLAGMPEDVKAQTKEYEHFVEVLGNGTSKMKDCKDAANQLATAYVTSNNFLANLTEGKEDYYTSVLKEMGVENAGTIVTNVVTANKEKQKLKTKALAAATKDMADETSNASKEFVKEANMSNLAKAQLADLAAKEKVYNSTTLSTSDKVKELNKLALAYFGVSDAIQISSAMGSDSRYWKNPGDYEKAVQKQWDKLIKKQTKLSVGTVKVDEDKNSGKKNPKTKTKNTKNTKTEIDWLSRRLTRMQSIIDLTAAKLQNLFSVKAKNNNLNKQIKETTALMNQYGIAAKRYKKKADSVAKGYTKKIKSGKNKGKKKKVKPLSKDIISKIQSGKITKASYNKLIKMYGQDEADRINKYIDYYDKAQDARKNKQDAKAKARDLQKQKFQNYVDLYDSRTARAEAKESIQTNAKDKNKTIDTQIKNTKLSYEYQIKIANLSKNKAEAERLSYELQQKTTELEQEKLQNYVDEYNASADLAEINSSNAIGYAKQNSYISIQLSWLKKSYDKQIEIAGLSKDTTEQSRLQAEYEAKKVELQQQQIDNLKKDYENRIGLINNDKQDVSNSLAETEARGDIIQAAFYSSLNSYEEKVLADLKEEREKLQAEQNTFQKYSQKWYDLQSDIQSVDNSISEANQSIIENNKKIGELRQTMYDDIAARNSDVSSEAQFLAGLLGNNLTDDKTGSLIKEGLGVLGTYGIELEANTNTAENYKTERKEIEDAIARYNSGDVNALSMYGSLHAAEEKLADVIKKQQEAISAEYSSMKDIYDLMVQKYEAQLAYMKSIIDAKKQVLNMEKDLYDYQKNIANQTKNIAALEKQLTALKGDDSEEGRARRAKLQVSLDEAEQNLQDTEYERYISDQENMLDNMYNQYEDLLCALEKDFETVVNDGLQLVATNASGISTTLNTLAGQYGYNPSNDMQEILNCLKIYETDDNGNILVDSEGNALVKTLPDTIKDGLSNLGTIFDKLADEIRKSYNGGNGGSGSNGSGGNGSGGGGSTGGGGTDPTGRFDAENAAQQVTEQKSALTEILEKASYAKEATKPSSSYKSTLNQKLADLTGYVVTIDEGYTASKFLQNIKGDGSSAAKPGKGGSYYAEDGSVYKELKKKYPLLGFRTGGIVRADGVPKDGDNVLVRVNPNETVLTQDFTKILPETVDIMKDFVKVPDYARLVQPRQVGNTFGDIVINAELPNVKDGHSFVSEVQNEIRSRRFFEACVNDIADKGKITSNIQRF